MKTTVNINQKIGQPNYGSFGAGVSIELDIDQAMLSKPGDVLAQIRFAADIARAAVDRELDLQRKHAPAAREPGADDDLADEDLRPGDRGYVEPVDERRSNSRPAERRENDRPVNARDGYDDRPRDEPRRGRDDRGGDRRGSGGGGRQKRNWKHDGGRPKTGSQLWGFARDYDEGDGGPCVAFFNALGKSWNLPQMFRDWADADVADAVHEFFAKRPDQRAPANGRQS